MMIDYYLMIGDNNTFGSLDALNVDVNLYFNDNHYQLH